MDSTVFRPLHTPSCTVRCSHCNLREICLPVGLTREELEHIDNRLVSSRRKVARGEALFRVGDRFDALFAVWTGFFKTVVTGQQGVALTLSQTTGLTGVTGSGTASMSFTGTVANINAALNGLTLNTNTAETDLTFTITVDDGGLSVVSDTFTINVNA